MVNALLCGGSRAVFEFELGYSFYHSVPEDTIPSFNDLFIIVMRSVAPYILSFLLLQFVYKLVPMIIRLRW